MSGVVTGSNIMPAIKSHQEVNLRCSTCKQTTVEQASHHGERRARGSNTLCAAQPFVLRGEGALGALRKLQQAGRTVQNCTVGNGKQRRATAHCPPPVSLWC